MVVIKIVDDILATGTDEALRSFLKSFGNKLTLGEITKGPGRLRFFGFNIFQLEYFSCKIDGEEKLGAIEPYPLFRVRPRQSDEVMNAIEISLYVY